MDSTPAVWLHDERPELQHVRAAQRRQLAAAQEAAGLRILCHHKALRLETQRVHPESQPDSIRIRGKSIIAYGLLSYY